MDERSDPLLRLKAGGEGLEVELHREAPGLLARILPVKLRMKREATEAVARRLTRKLERDEALDEAELSFAAAVLGENVARYARIKSVAARAEELTRALPAPPKDAGPRLDEASPASETSEDWVNKFRDDAGLVDDEVVREIYARVLVEEQHHPGAFSLRTLAVLRYLDHGTAHSFGLLQRVVIDNSSIPLDQALLKACGITHSMLLDLDDAGLVNMGVASKTTRSGSVLVYGLQAQRQLVALQREDGSDFSVSLKVHLLTPAGRQLARIAQCERHDFSWRSVANWIASGAAEAVCEVAETPITQWTGQLEALSWTPLVDELRGGR